MIVLGFFTCGLAPLVAGMTGWSDQAKHQQAVTLVIVGAVLLVISGLLVMGSASTWAPCATRARRPITPAG